MIVLHPIYFRHPIHMRATEQLYRRLSILYIKAINTTRLHHYDSRVLGRAPVQRTAEVGAKVARHFGSAFDNLGEGVQSALRGLETFGGDHEVRAAEEGACDLAVVEAGAHELWR